LRSNLHWQDYHLQALQVQAALYRQGGPVVQQADEPVSALSGSGGAPMTLVRNLV
jgi:hypothetical protein